MNPFEKIEAYLNGSLSEEEKLFMVNAIANNDDLKSQVEEYKNIKILKEALIEEDLLNMVENLNTDSNNLSRKKLRFISAIILIAISLAFSLFLFKNSEEDNVQALFAQNYQEPIWEISRSNSENNQIAKAVNYFEINEISKAVEELNSISASNKYYSLARLYIGEMNLARGDIEEAIVTIESLPGSDRKDWLLALALMKKGEYLASLEKLEIIGSQKNHSYQEKADQLRKNLERIKK